MPTPPINEHALTERRAATQRIQAFINRHHDRVDEQYVRGLRAGMLLVEHEDLTGAPRPSSASAPSDSTALAVDEDLLRDIGYAADEASDHGHWPRASVEALKTAWRERDESRAEVERLQDERDFWQQGEALRRAQLEEAFEQRDRLLNGDMPLWEVLVGNHNTATARATLERLRAVVPDLPDVGTVTPRDEDGYIVVDGLRYDGGRKGAQLHRDVAQDHLRWYVRSLVVAAEIDREAEEQATTGSTTALAPDVYALAVALRDYDAPGVGTDGPDFDAYLADAQAVIDRRRASAQAIVDGADDELADAFSIDLDSGR